jgi:hypothetical protein
MCAAGAGGFLLGVTSAAVPNTFSERHSGPPCAEARENVAATVQAMCPETSFDAAARWRAGGRVGRELSFPLRSQSDD